MIDEESLVGSWIVLTCM